MQLNQPQADHIARLYFEGGYDSEIESYLMIEGFPLGYFASEYESNPKFKLLIDACRIHARAYWERLLRQNVGNKSFNVPAWVMAVRGQAMTQYEDKKTSLIDNRGGNMVLSVELDTFMRQMALEAQQRGILIEGATYPQIEADSLKKGS